jgi:succinate-semialdehyde dehydrogenase/glutarate-semialdehyde dehydrogenase
MQARRGQRSGGHRSAAAGAHGLSSIEQLRWRRQVNKQLAWVTLDDQDAVVPLLIDGAAVRFAATIPVTDPATGKVFARIASADVAVMRQAIAAAERARQAWAARSARQRSESLTALADQVMQHAEQFATIITRENGKPLEQSRGEVTMSVAHLRWFAEEGPRAYGRVIPHQDPAKRSIVIRQPVGVCGAISPWNFPLLLAVRKIAPALAAGCPVILKPSEVTPLTAAAFAECTTRIDLPPGVFQMIVGDAPRLVSELMASPIVRKVSFTGSTRVGQILIGQAAATVKRLSLELGGNAPALVFDDAAFDQTLDAVLAGKFRNTGQACNGINRIYVQRGIADRFAHALADRVRAMKIGAGTESGVQIGPVISPAARDRMTALVADATKRGATLLAGGHPINRPGNFFEPTVLYNVPQTARVMQEEIFGPIAPIATFDSEADALRLANDTSAGLAGFVYTDNLNRALRVGEALDVGMIGLNDGVPTVTHSPFGGMKMSGWGRELGTEGLDAYLETKHISIGGMS